MQPLSIMLAITRHVSAIRRLHILIGVVHVVLDGVKTLAVRARVLAGRAAKGGLGLVGGVVDAITGVAAAVVESVGETEPVTDLVGGGAAQVVRGVAAGEGAGADGAAITGDVGPGLVVEGQAAVAEGTVRVGQEEQVEGVVAALAEGATHVVTIQVGGPVLVDGTGRLLEAEGDALGGVVVVEDLELGCEGIILNGFALEYIALTKFTNG